MSDTIFVNHAALGQASSSLRALSDSLAGSARDLKQADAALAAAWQGVGSSAFRAAAQTVEELVTGISLVTSSEAASLSSANAGFSDQDEAVAASIGASGQ